jgi:hypothetical protein
MSIISQNKPRGTFITAGNMEQRGSSPSPRNPVSDNYPVREQILGMRGIRSTAVITCSVMNYRNVGNKWR